MKMDLSTQRCRVEGRGTSRHEARTWVTLEGMDIGNTFGLDWGFFARHGVEIPFFGASARAFCKTGLAGPTTVCGKLPFVWHQPQDRLQMAAAFSGPGDPRAAGPVAPAQTSAPSNFGLLAAPDPRFAAAAPALGSQKNPGAIAAAIFSQARAGSAYHHPLAATLAVDPAAACPPAQGAADLAGTA